MRPYATRIHRYEDDIFGPCTDPSRCTPPNSLPNNPVRDTHSNPLTLNAPDDKFMQDKSINCSDPNVPEHYRCVCVFALQVCMCICTAGVYVYIRQIHQLFGPQHS